MTERVINSSIKTALVNNDDFVYAHLVKFERPFDPVNAAFRTGANRYAYYTDGATDISFNDGSGNGSQTYRANRITKLGSYSETVKAKATSMNLVFASEELGASVEIAGTLSTSGVFTPTSSIHNGEPIDFVEQGFKEGDTIKFSYSSTTLIYVITGFTTNNTVITTARTGTDSDDSAFPGSNLTQTFTIEQDSIELTAPVQDRGITATNTAEANPNFLNREVFIHKVFINPDDGSIIGNTSIQIFKGIVAKVGLVENVTSSKVTWSLTSHWGDFEEVNGRLTTDEVHRALSASSEPQLDSTIRPEYAADLGFMHAETSLSAIANYQTQETRMRMKSKRRGGLAGLFGGKKYTMEEYQVDVQNEVDLNVHLQGKFLPVIYGVQRVNGNPIFADTLNSDSKTVFTVDAICEGEIHGLYNMYIDDIPVICTDDNDYDVRNVRDGTDKDNTQLQCFGKMSRGNTMSGTVYVGTVNSETNQNAGTVNSAYVHSPRDEAAQNGVIINADSWGPWQGGTIKSLAAGNAGGLNHGATYNISSPYTIEQQFMHGRPNQLASQMLVNVAEGSDRVGSVSVLSKGYNFSGTPTITFTTAPSGGTTATGTVVMGSAATDDENQIRSVRIDNPGAGYVISPTITLSDTTKGGNLRANLGGYKRQTDYWTGNLPYWSPNHRLLDTAYAATKFEIDADATSIPEIEYVVKGKVIECYNYDNTYVPDEVAGASDDEADFSEGDLVVVEYWDGSQWQTDSTGTHTSNKFKIMDKYSFTTSRGDSHYRFRLDTTPNLVLVNARASTGRTKLRLKSGSNYWHMITWDHKIVSDETFPNNWVTCGANVSNVSGILTIQNISDSDKAKFPSSNPRVQFYAPEWYTDTPGDTVGLKYGLLRGEWSGSSGANTLSFPGTDWSGHTFPNTIKIACANEFLMSSISEVNAITNAAELTSSYTEPVTNNTIFSRGAILHNLTTGESREITAFNTSTKKITIETAFLTPSYSDHKFTIEGRGADRRASTNPAMQTLDFLKDKKFGKGFTETDLDLTSFVTSAKLCDARSDITIKLANSPSGVAEGDVFQITTTGASNGVHVASGTVATGGVDATNKTVTLTNVINKFAKAYSTYTSIQTGDYVYTEAGNFYRATGAIASPPETVPTHTSGTTLSLEAISGTVDIHKVSGSGSVSTLNMDKITTPIDYSLYDSDWIKYWRYYGWEHHHQREVTRHQTNFILDTGKSVFANINAMLSHYNGLLSYENGKYVLDVETQEDAPASSSPYYVQKEDIIGKIAITDNSQKTGKNTIKASLADPQLNFGTRSVTFFNSDFLKADRGKIKTGSFPFTGITNYYNARVNTEKELFQSRFSKEVSFTLGPQAILLRPGQVLSMNYPDFGWANKLFRIENLNFASNCNVSVKAREYDDSIYEITKQQAKFASSESSSQFSLKAPGEPLLNAPSTNKNGSIELSWVNAADFVEGSDSTEVWYHTSNARANASLLAVVDNAQTFTLPSSVAATYYFWIRHRRIGFGNTGNKLHKVFGPYYPTSASGGLTGTSLSISAGAQTIRLRPTTFVVDYTKVGAESSAYGGKVNFNVDAFNLDGTVFYEFLVNGTQKQHESLSSSALINDDPYPFVLAESDEPEPGDAPVQVIVKARQGSTTGTLLAQDSVSIFAVQDGQSTPTGILTNEAHTVPAANDGTVSSFSNAGGTFKVYYGNTDITTNAKTTFSVQSTTGTVTSAITTPQGVYSVSALGSDTATVTFACLIKGSLIGGVDSTDDLTVTKVYTISKAKAGIPGVGSAGADAKSVKLTANDYSLVYNAAGSSPSPSSITLTATAQGFTDPYFKFTGDSITEDSNYVDENSPHTHTFNVPSSHFTDPKSIKVSIQEGDSGGEVAFDTISIFAVKPGAAGDDSHTGFLTNSAHVVATDNDGTGYSYTGAGGTFERYDGASDKTGSATTYYVGASGTNLTETKNGLTMTITQSTGVYALSGGSWTSDLETFTMRAIYDSVTVTSVYTISKSKKGSVGTAAYSGFLTNESTSALFYEYYGGNYIDYAGTGGEFKTFNGATELTSGVAYAITGGSSSGGNSTKVNSGLTMVLNESTGVWGILTGTSWTTDSESFTLTATKGSDVITKIFSINKATQGGKVEITATGNQFVYNGLGASPSPTTITLTALDYGYDYTPHFKWESSTNGGSSWSTVQAYSTDADIVVSAPSYSAGGTLYKVTMKATASGAFVEDYIVDQDEITLSRVKEGSQGDPGDDGDNTAIITLYKRSSSGISAPAVPDNNIVYTFADASISGSLDSWTTTVPSGAAQYLWTTTATAIGVNGATTGTIDANLISAGGDWATPTVQSEAQQPRTFTKAVFYDNWTSGTVSAPTSTGFDWDDMELDGLSTGWSNSLATLPFAYCVYDATEDTYGGTTTVTFQPVGYLTSIAHTLPTDLQNDQISMAADGILSGGGTSVQVNLNSIPDAGNTKTYAARAGNVINVNNKITGTVTDGTNDFTPAELLKVRGSFANVSTTPVLNVANANTALKNASITIASDGKLTGIGTDNIKVNNAKTEFSELQGTKPPSDANKVVVAAGTDGRVSVNVNGAGASNIEVFSTTDRQKLTNLRAGNVPGDGSGTTTDSIQNDDIEINASGQLTGIGTDSIKVNNAKITTKADGTLNYDGTTAATPSLASISGTVPRTKGGFGIDIDALVGNAAKIPRWNGSAWVADTPAELRAEIGAGTSNAPDLTVDGGGTVHTNNYTNSQYDSTNFITAGNKSTYDAGVLTANAAMPKAGGAFTGNVTTTGTFDGVDIATKNTQHENKTQKFDADGNVAGGVAVGSKITIDSAAERILIED